MDNKNPQKPSQSMAKARRAPQTSINNKQRQKREQHMQAKRIPHQSEWYPNFFSKYAHLTKFVSR